MHETSPRRTRTAAWVAMGVSVGVDLVVVIVAAGTDVYRCPDGWSTVGGSFRRDTLVMFVVAALAIVVSVRSVNHRPPEGPGRADLAVAVIVAAAFVGTLATWIVLHHRPNSGCFD